MATNSAVHHRIWPNFEPIRDFMAVLITLKNVEELIENEGIRLAITLYIEFQWWDLAEMELIQAFMIVLIICKYQNDWTISSLKKVKT